MALTDLLAAIESDAAGELDAARRQAERQTEDILASASARAAAHRAAAVAEATRAGQAEAPPDLRGGTGTILPA